MRIAIIDLGTNTFNLLIADIAVGSKHRHVYNTRVAVRLGEGGINKNFITPTAFERGVNAIMAYKQVIDNYKVEKTCAFATSAVRGASNGSDFVNRIKIETGIDVEVISGDREAELIYKGVREAVNIGNTPSLIIDIGGGSTEFIIATQDKVVWKYSFLLGVARIQEKFKTSDPITADEILRIEEHFEQELELLFAAVKKYPVKELIGSSGSFESLADMITSRFYKPDILNDKTEYEFNLNDVEQIHKDIVTLSREQRLKLPGLIEMRVDMIVIASIIVNFILKRISLTKMRLSTYALKEGFIAEFTSKQNL